MINKLGKIVISMFLLLIIVNCGTDDSISTTDDVINIEEEKEEEQEEVDCSVNCFQCAGEINLGENVVDKLEEENEVDYFKFTLDQDGVLEIKVNATPDNLRLKSDLLNVDCEEVFSETANNTGEGYTALYLIKAGDYVLKFSDSFGKVNNNDYSFSITLNTDDVYEINNSCDDAADISIGNEINMAIYPEDDIDYFKFSTTEPGVIKIDFYNVPENINLETVLRSSSDCIELVEEINNDLGEGLSLYYTADAGDYILEINDRFNDEFNADLLSFMVTLETSDIYEINNSCTSAKEISLDTEIKAAIYPEDDVDNFKFTTTEEGVLKIELFNIPENINLDVTLRSFSDCTELLSDVNNDIGEGLTLYYTAEAGDYVLEINDRFNDSFNVDLYSVNVSLDTSDIYEINNSCSSAKDIEINTEVNTAIYPEDDVDFFQFTVTEAGNVDILLYNVPDNINLEVTLRSSPDCLEIAKEINNTEGEGLSLMSTLEPGIYILEINDRFNDSFNSSFLNFKINL
ncbi:hypothetical protein [Maribacter aquivivus]|uniref:hypothetical protein n=1 Tax=Maribacter aquivivus TaxID=228958 RepID=UPI0024943F2E|nr:hypothetical protein [Maribacter aquivivus]